MWKNSDITKGLRVYVCSLSTTKTKWKDIIKTELLTFSLTRWELLSIMQRNEYELFEERLEGLF